MAGKWCFWICLSLVLSCARTSFCQNTSRSRCVVSVRGIPKSGTTWLEFVIQELLKTACDTKVGCKYTINPDGIRGAKATGIDTMHGCNDVQLVVYHKHRIGEALLTTFGHPHMSIDHQGTVAYKVLSECLRKGILPYSTSCHDRISMNLNVDEIKVTDDCSVRFINIMRDPRAIAVSACHYFMANKPLSKCQYNEAKVFEVNTAVAAYDFIYWTKKYNRGCQSANTIHYESLKEQPYQGLHDVADYIGVTECLDDTSFRSLVKKTSVSAMSHLQRGELPGSQSGEPGQKVRNGSRWGFLHELTDTALIHMNETMLAILPSELLEVYGLAHTMEA